MRVQCKAEGPVTSSPVFQFSSLPVLQSSSFPDPVPVGVGVWRPILENPFLGGCRGASSLAAAWIATPLEEPPAPKFAYLASSWRSCAPSWLILALLGLILSPSCSKMAPSWPNIAQHRAKMRQHGFQEHPQEPRKLQKTYKNLRFFRFSAIWLFAPNILKSGQDTFRNGLILAILKSKMAILGPSWRQVGQFSAIYALT